MAHNLDIAENGVARMAYVGDKPWHGMGVQVMQAMTSAEAIEMAQLDWDVRKDPVYTHLSHEMDKPIPDFYATVREDNNAVLGIVKNKYQILSNKNAFSFMDALVGEKAAMYHTAGALRGGRKIWMLVKLPEDVAVKGVDLVKNYMLLSNSHDGSSAIRVMFTPIRVVCDNTLTLGEMQGLRKTAVRHSGNLGAKVDVVASQLGIIKQWQSMFKDASEAMASKSINQQIVDKFLDEIGLKLKEVDETGRANSVKEEQRDMIKDLITSGKGNNISQIKGTAWAAYNAVTEFVDFHKPVRGGDADVKTDSILYGAGAALKIKAFDAAINMIGA